MYSAASGLERHLCLHETKIWAERSILSKMSLRQAKDKNDRGIDGCCDISPRSSEQSRSNHEDPKPDISIIVSKKRCPG